jgi:type IV secretion system protein VirB10
MNRTPELEAMLSADETAVSNKNVKRNQLLGMSALLLAGAASAYFVLAAPQERPRDVTDGDEEFRTTTFRPPSFVREEE